MTRRIVRAEAADLGRIELADPAMRLLSNSALVDRLVVSGYSRLTAERFVELERGSAEPGRARPHTTARR
jgi:hypothetical protein